MKRDELNTVLRDQARELGLCDEWYGGWKNETKQQLIEKYLKGIDFCIKHDYPSLDFIERNFDEETLIENGIFVNHYIEAENTRMVVALGNSSGSLRYNGVCSCEVYVRHNSEVDITAADGAKVFVEVYEQGKIHITSSGAAKVFVYKHGGDVVYEGNVKVRNKTVNE